MVAAYPFASVMWTMVVFFVWIMWFWLLFGIWADIFRRDDLSGWGKTGWLVFTIVLPFLGVFVYLITQSHGMTRRGVERARAGQEGSQGRGRGARAAATAGGWRMRAGGARGAAKVGRRK